MNVVSSRCLFTAILVLCVYVIHCCMSLQTGQRGTVRPHFLHVQRINTDYRHLIDEQYASDKARTDSL